MQAKERKEVRLRMNKKLKEKILESLSAVMPITLIVLALCITVTPMPLAPLMLFLAGACLLIVGMGLFTLGADMAMLPIGEHIGLQLAKTRKLPFIVICCLVIGAAITIAEPGLTVLAGQTPAVPSLVLILAVAIGTGVFLIVGVLRTLFGWTLSRILILFYLIIFVLAFFVPQDFLAVAFDSGGATTGSITVPFLMALGIGLASLGKSKKSSDGDSNSFGLIGICSIGPILAVMILGMLYRPETGNYEPTVIPEILSTQDLALEFGHAFPQYIQEVLAALIPVALIFVVFQLLFLHLGKKQLVKIIVGLVYTFLGLTLFLTGVNVGFMPVGNFIGQELATLDYRFILVPIGMVLGYFIIKAEPSVIVLNQQVEDLTGGAISEKVMMSGLSLGMAISVGLSMLRVLLGIPLLAILIPGYALALGLSFAVPKIFTAIAFDSGGVASGPMTSTFLLPLAMGACEAVGGNILVDAFGIVAMVAMTPLIIIQLIGLLYKFKTGGFKRKQKAQKEILPDEDELISLKEEKA